MTQELDQGHLYRSFFKYVSLNVLSMMGLSLYILADTFFVANGVGNDGLVAMNLVIPVFSFIQAVGLLLGIGGGTRFSILMGEGKPEHGSKIFMQTVYIGVAVGIVITVLGIFCPAAIIRVLGATDDIVHLGTPYLQTLMCFSIAFILNQILIGFVRNDRNPNLSMIAMLVSSGSNVVLDAIFVFPLQMGMFGAALATGFSPLFSMLVLSFHFILKKNHFRPEKCKFRFGEMGRIVLAGIPSFINELSIAVTMLVFNFVILSISGNVGVGAYGIISNIAIVCVCIFTGIGQGIQPLVSFSHGKGRGRDIKKFYLCACALALLFGVFFYLAGLLFPDFIVGLFNNEGDPVLAQIAREGILLYFLSFLIMGVNVVSTLLFSSIAHPRQAMIISSIRGFAASIPLVFLLPIGLGMTGVWLTIPLTELITLAVTVGCAFLYFRKIKRQEKQNLSS